MENRKMPQLSKLLLAVVGLLIGIAALAEVGVALWNNNISNDMGTDKRVVVSWGSVEEELSQKRRKLLLSVKDAIGIGHAAAAATTPYGPNAPRVAAVVVGIDPSTVLTCVASIFRNTEWDRIFTVVAILDGIAPTETIQQQFTAIDYGKLPLSTQGRRSAANTKTRTAGEKGLDVVEITRNVARDPITVKKQKKIKLIFNPTKKGVGASRQYGAEFIRRLEIEHEAAGLKSHQERLILLFLRFDAILQSHGWMDVVSSALMGSYDEMSSNTTTTTHFVANAVSLAVDYIKPPEGTVSAGLVSPRQIVQSPPRSVVTFDLTLEPQWTTRSMNGNEGNSEIIGAGLSNLLGNAELDAPYWTPALLGAATAFSLDVYLSLPARDSLLDSQFASDLELSLNFWLCGDGIDVLPQARVAVDPSLLTIDSQITDDNAARIAATWMGKAHQEAVFRARAQSDQHKGTMAKLAREALWARTLPANVKKKCRSFTWYSSDINRNVYVPGVLSAVEEAQDVDPLERRKDSVALGVLEAEEVIDSGVTTQRKQYFSDTNVAIISMAKFHDIRYVDYSNGHKAHPHMGAKDANGILGYIHDPTSLRQNPPTYHLDDLSSACQHDSNYKMLTEKVAIDLMAHNSAERGTRPRVKILCVIYSIEKNHYKLQNVRETWAQKCDGFMVASTKTDPSLGTVEILHEGPEDYYNIWQKVRAIWSYVYDNYYQDYDWFHIGGDDLYILLENLRLYLESDEIRSAENGGKEPWEPTQETQIPIILGRRFAEWGDMNRIFLSGGSGYTINKATLKALVRSFATCFPHMKTSAEDVLVSACLRKQGILPVDTRDKNGGERYMPFRPGHHFDFTPPTVKDWYVAYTIGEFKLGLDHCAVDSIAFHYIDPELMKRMHAILYGHCQRK